MTKSRGILAPRAVWTEEQLQVLRTFYPDYKAEDVAVIVRHTVHAIYRKAKVLGLKKSEAFYASEAAGRLDGVRGGGY